MYVGLYDTVHIHKDNIHVFIKSLNRSHDASQVQVIESLETVEVPHRPEQVLRSGFRKAGFRVWILWTDWMMVDASNNIKLRSSCIEDGRRRRRKFTLCISILIHSRHAPSPTHSFFYLKT